MTEYYVNKLKSLQTNYPEIFMYRCAEILGRTSFNLEDLNTLPEETLKDLVKHAENKIALLESPIDARKLARELQGLLSVSECKCHKCEGSGTTKSPEICFECALKLANHLAVNYKNFMLKYELP